MAEFSDFEKLLLKRIPQKSELRTGLSLLREASEGIWEPGGPRVIRDFTDHGIAHSVRIADYASQLLGNSGKKLSKEEMYLLLAGIYLHDTGMQCDVVRHPEIKEQAEKLGSKFGVTFTAQLSSDYSVEEQKAIRKNHHFLSIAWIDYAHRTGETLLGLAARRIPGALVDDLMDVCKHHTSLPIDACPEKFSRSQSGRKQMVAALLRIADELDIAANRVRIDTVQTFSLDPSNAIFWWLHNCTTIAISENNVVRMHVWLHPEDAAQYEQIVQSVFIDRFIQKNQIVVSVLADAGIHMTLDPRSSVKESDREKRLPPEIRAILKSMFEPQRKPPATKETGGSKRDEAAVSLTSVQAALRELRGKFEEVRNLLADSELSPLDCDKIISLVDESEQSYGRLQTLLMEAAQEMDLAAVVREFWPLRYKLEEWMQQLRQSVSQFRGRCPPALPRDHQKREALHSLSDQPVQQLLEFESLLPSSLA